jgi:hypothetical protein
MGAILEMVLSRTIMLYVVHNLHNYIMELHLSNKMKRCINVYQNLTLKTQKTVRSSHNYAFSTNFCRA